MEDAKKNVDNQKPVYQFCIKGKMLLDLNCTEEAMQEFRILQDQIIKRFDSYIVLSLGNIYYEWSTRLRSQE